MKAVLACLSALLLLNACVTGPRDAGGTTMQLSDAKDIGLTRTDLDIPLYLHDHIASVTQEIRDNTSPIDKYNLGERGTIQTQRAENWFSDRTEARLKNRESFDEQLERLVGGKNIQVEEVAELQHEGNIKAVGFAATLNRGPVSCLYANGGYRLGGPTPYDNDTGLIDTVVEVLFCGPEDGIGDVRKMLSAVRKVSDRAVYEAKLKKAGA
jgi:hypothetical protein